MRATKVIQYALIGKCGFPMDVLRQTRSWPSSPIDANEVVETYKGGRKPEELPFLVRLTGHRVPDEAEPKRTSGAWHPTTTS